MNDYLGPYLLGPNDTPENGIYTGDARELARAIPDESVDLIFTDPVYQNIDDYRWLAETGARVLKENGSCLAFAGNTYVIAAGSAMLGLLDARPPLAQYITGPKARLFNDRLQCNRIPLLWFSKGRPANYWMAIQQSDYLSGIRGHKWGKNWQMIRYRLTKFPGIAVDPFSGGGTLPAVCKMLGRRYLAFEIDPAVAEMARERVRNTQTPLPGLEVTQAEMELPDGC